MICFVCGQTVNEYGDYEWFGMDGDKIHKKCKPNLNKATDLINNMSDEQFSQWISNDVRGEDTNGITR